MRGTYNSTGSKIKKVNIYWLKTEPITYEIVSQVVGSIVFWHNDKAIAVFQNKKLSLIMIN